MRRIEDLKKWVKEEKSRQIKSSPAQPHESDLGKPRASKWK